MTYRLSITIAAFAVLFSGLLSFAGVGEGEPGRKSCAEQRSAREVAQDETRIISELCTWRDDSLRRGDREDREMTLARDVPPAG